MTTAPAYVPFANVPVRNGLQASIEVPALVRALRLPRGGRVLEIGCGRGIALPVLARLLQPSLLIGLDIDASLVALAALAAREAAGHATQVDAMHGDAQSMPFDDASFDLVIDFGTCYHVPDSLAVMREVARVLRPNGLFVHETPVSQHLAHPVRSFGRRLPWRAVPSLRRRRTALLWTAREKIALPVSAPIARPVESPLYAMASR